MQGKKKGQRMAALLVELKTIYFSSPLALDRMKM